MKLNPIAANVTEIEVNDNLVVLFSYKTPVACRRRKNGIFHNYRTSKKWSVTTSKHITKWFSSMGIDKAEVAEISQDELDKLVK